VNYSCGNCKTIRSFSGDPPACDTCGWVLGRTNNTDTPYWQDLRAQRQESISAESADHKTYSTDYDSDYTSGANNDDVVEAINRVERAIKEKWSLGGVIFAGFCLVFLWSVAKDMWYSKWRLGWAYGVPTEKIIIDKTPHDCDFFTAPIGRKHCSYDSEVTTIRWATSTDGNPIVSYDDGKTWSGFTPGTGESVPRQPSIIQVVVAWKKSDD